MNKFDTIIIGGGPSGMMAAIASSFYGHKTMIIEKNKRFGKKLSMTGGGRCNVTNVSSINEIIENIPGNGRFLHSTFSQFDNQDIIAFFEDNNCALKVEDHGRMFPTTDKSITIINTLIDKMCDLDVTLKKQTEVVSVKKIENTFFIKTNDKKECEATRVIVATGGKTYPSTGSTGFGYEIARHFKIPLTKLRPSESPLIMLEPLKELQGISMKDITLKVGKKIITHDILFTHFGLSGPAALRASTYITSPTNIYIDLFADKSLDNLVISWVKFDRNKAIKNTLKNVFQERVLLYLLKLCEIDPQTPLKQVSKSKLQELAYLSKNWMLSIESTFSLEKSFVTAGGVELKNINPKSLESKTIPGLYFVGEVLDINAHTGGYNITSALATGWVAGIN